jgi:hypothetical protein
MDTQFRAEFGSTRGGAYKVCVPLEHDGITAHTFTEAQVVYQIGIAPVRIDILTEITGVEFADAWTKKSREHFLRCSGALHFPRRSHGQQTGFGPRQ